MRKKVPPATAAMAAFDEVGFSSRSLPNVANNGPDPCEAQR